MGPVKVKEGLYWIGALDPERRVFDIIMPLDRGTTYNSYLIEAERPTIVETVSVKPEVQEEFFANIRAFLDFKDIAYIVLNHLEPDHSGALENLLAKAPNAKVVVSKSGEHFVKNLLNREIDLLRMQDGDTLDLGGKTLRFITAPFVHWPDTMLTYLVEERVLFPCDFLGCHFSDERLFDDLVSDFSYYFHYYFNTIMRPYKDYAFKAIEKLESLKIDLIAPSHGPILRTDPQRYIDLYREWSSPQPKVKKRALIFYASAYGNTARMAQEIARGVEEEEVEVALLNLEEVVPAEVLEEIEEADALIVGSPTFVGDAIKPIWDLLSSLTTIKVKGKVGAAFGSYGWSGEAVGLIEERLRNLRFKVPEPGVRTILVPTAEDLESCRQLGRRIARNL